MFKTEGMLNLKFLPRGDYRVQNRTPFVAQFQAGRPPKLRSDHPLKHLSNGALSHIFRPSPRAARQTDAQSLLHFFF